MGDFDEKFSGLGPELMEEAEDLASDIIAWRREFHQFPELAFEENLTATRVAQVLESTEGIRVHRGFGTPTSVIGVMGEDLPGPAVMLRADMDALAMEEETGLPFGSCIPGVMHGCGHDGHMASLLGASLLLSARRRELRRPVILLFQPAEEGKGGARKLTEAKLTSKFNIGWALGMHFWPKLPYGQFFTKPGPITALSDKFHIEIQGVGAHAATPHLGVDPIMIAAHVLLGLEHLVSREIDPLESAVISVGQIEAGEAYNIIPERAHLWGTARAFDTTVRNTVQERMENTVRDICRAFRGSASVEYRRNYPQTLNDPDFSAEVTERAAVFFGEDMFHTLERPLLAGEDFSFYSLEVPSCFMLLGTGGEYGLHHPKYDVPEELLYLASAWEAFLALTL